MELSTLEKIKLARQKDQTLSPMQAFEKVVEEAVTVQEPRITIVKDEQEGNFSIHQEHIDGPDYAHPIEEKDSQANKKISLKDAIALSHLNRKLRKNMGRVEEYESKLQLANEQIAILQIKIDEIKLRNS